MAALRVLAVTLRDVAAAEAYARAHLAPADYRALLHLVLEPGPGLEPRYDDACYLITALGGWVMLCGVWWGVGGGGDVRKSAGCV
jgi:hypothetical protein